MLEWHGDEAMNGMRNNLSEILKEIGEDLKRHAVTQTPIDTGALKKACTFKVELKGNSAELTVGYDSSVDAYSMVQHERTDFNHPRGGKAKFLEDPFNANFPKYREMLAGITNVGAQGSWVFARLDYVARNSGE